MILFFLPALRRLSLLGTISPSRPLLCYFMKCLWQNSLHLAVIKSTLNTVTSTVL